MKHQNYYSLEAGQKRCVQHMQLLYRAKGMTSM